MTAPENGNGTAGSEETGAASTEETGAASTEETGAASTEETGADETADPTTAEPTAEVTVGPDVSASTGALSARDRALLALERRSWASPGAKERAIREELGLSPVRYYQLVNALIEDRRALEADPVTVNRLRRVRDAKRSRR